MFWDIYYSFTNVNEGEFEARFKELGTMDELIHKFKTSGYFYDFMGEQDLTRMKPDTKKKIKNTKIRCTVLDCFIPLDSSLLFMLFKFPFQAE